MQRKLFLLNVFFLLFHYACLSHADWKDNNCVPGLAAKAVKLKYEDSSLIAAGGFRATVANIKKLASDKKHQETVFVELSTGMDSVNQIYPAKMFPYSIVIENKTNLVDVSTIPLGPKEKTNFYITDQGTVFAQVVSTESSTDTLSILNRPLYRSRQQLPSKILQFDLISKKSMQSVNYNFLEYTDLKNDKILYHMNHQTGETQVIPFKETYNFVGVFNSDYLFVGDFQKISSVASQNPGQPLPMWIYDIKNKKYLPDNYTVSMSPGVIGGAPIFSVKNEKNIEILSLQYEITQMFITKLPDGTQIIPGIGKISISGIELYNSRLTSDWRNNFINISFNQNSGGTGVSNGMAPDLDAYIKNNILNYVLYGNDILCFNPAADATAANAPSGGFANITDSEIQAIVSEIKKIKNQKELNLKWQTRIQEWIKLYQTNGYNALSASQKWASVSWLINQRKLRQNDFKFIIQFYLEQKNNANIFQKKLALDILSFASSKIPIQFQSSLFFGIYYPAYNSQLQSIQNLPLTLESIDFFAKNLAKILLKKYQHKSNQGQLSINDLMELKIYQNVFNKEQKESIANELGDYMAPLATSTQNNPGNVLAGAFPSLINWMITQRVREILGLNEIALTDLWIKPAQGGLNAVVDNSYNYSLLSTHEIFSNEFNKFVNLIRLPQGIYYFGTNYLNIHDFLSYSEQEKKNGRLVKTIYWDTSERNFKAEIFAKPNLEKPYASLPLTKIKKEDFLSDKILRGAILFGSNFDKKLIDWTLQDYIEYLKENNFEVDNEISLSDSVSYFKNLIMGDKPIDYFLKEAHSDGDTRNLLSIQKDGKLIIARKKTNSILSEPAEEIYILFGDGNYKNPVYLSNQDFAGWIHERDKNQNSALLYINSSCSSYSKAAAELSAVRSDNFVEVASIHSVTVFANSEDNVMYKMLEGIRQFKSFEDLSMELKKSQQKVFVFPFESEYDTYVRTAVTKGYDVFSKLYRMNNIEQNWESYQIEAELNSQR